ncbi:hypothetical protein [Agrococcus baldri]|uniref:hypothetical protein n=1 Tax=Agrococcus baldri TaxID=153730 RepID=UPI0011607E37|nr:hypothetical protein [Agrococcus baldri]
MKKPTRLGIIVASVCACLLGLGVGTAAAQGAFVLAPAGLSPADGADSATAPTPEYAVNAEELTYGSAADAISPDTEPDLILVEYSAGMTGYVLKSDLDGAQGPGDEATPEEVLAWQAVEGQSDRSIPVYDVSGQTIIGEFVIAGIDTER